jgi:hypothetical protein
LPDKRIWLGGTPSPDLNVRLSPEPAMPSLFSAPDAHPLHATGAVIDAASRWVQDDDDVMLGCECANPALQIERWGQEDAAAPALAS